MRILDRYVLSQFLRNFVATLSVLILIFVFHTIWTYIDELAGRGLELWIIGKFLLFFIPQLIPIIMPLAVVVSSIMTFGAFAENYEFAAMKASGISLLRIMRPLIILMTLLCIGTFFLANNLIPVAYREVRALRENIAKVKPAMAISEGIFSKVGDDISIKVSKKHGDNDQYLENVLIHKKAPDLVNRTVINAKHGELRSSKNNSGFLQLILRDGSYYEDIKTNSYEREQKVPFAKVHFDKYIINMDLSHLNDVDFNEKSGVTTYRMMNVGQLSYAIDSLKSDFKQSVVDYGDNMFRRMPVFTERNDPSLSQTPEKKKTPPKEIKSVRELIHIVKPERRGILLDMAMSNNQSRFESVDFRQTDVEFRYKQMNLHIINLSDKFALAVACFVLFFVAAPLGAVIRKGGIGLPLVFAMILFLTYYFLGLFVKNIAENNTINPALAPWIPALLLLPLGVYLTYMVTTDKAVFQFEWAHRLGVFLKPYFRWVGVLRNFIKKIFRWLFAPIRSLKGLFKKKRA